jgi:DNA repair ATPase RecN
MPDPIKPVVDGLKSTIAVPQSTGSGTSPDDWKSATAMAANAQVTNAINTLMSLLYTAGDKSFTSVGDAIVTALGDVTTALRQLAAAIATLTASASDVSAAMDQLQQALALAQTLLPSGPVAVLNSAGTLFQQIQNLLSGTASLDDAAIELYQLAQQLDFVATTLKPPS